jgi:hypothetical protein
MKISIYLCRIIFIWWDTISCLVVQRGVHSLFLYTLLLASSVRSLQVYHSPTLLISRSIFQPERRTLDCTAFPGESILEEVILDI